MSLGATAETQGGTWINKFEHKGRWWLPRNPDNLVYGTLTFDPTTGTRLQLFGLLADSGEVPNTLDLDLILGDTPDSKRITLYKCIPLNSQIGAFPVSSYHVDTVIVGTHFEEPADIRLGSVSVRYTHLNEWVNLPALRMHPAPKGEALIIEPPEPRETCLPSGYKITIYRRIGPSVTPGPQDEPCIVQNTLVGIRARTDCSLDDYWEVAQAVAGFVALGVGKPVYPLAMAGERAWVESAADAPGVREASIEIFRQLRTIPESGERMAPGDMLFNFRDLGEEWGHYLGRWLERKELLAPIYDLYLGVLYSTHMYLEHEFLSLAQALESFHRRTAGGKYETDDVYRQGLYEQLLKALPGNLCRSFEQALRGRLNYGNEYSLRTRLKELLGKHHSLVAIVVKEPTQFVDDVVNTRNYLTHYDQDLARRTQSGLELYRLVQMVRFLLEACLLCDVGMPNELVKCLLKRSMARRRGLS